MNILENLTILYEDLAEKGEVTPFGWSPIKISYILDIDLDGNLNSASSVLEELTSAKGKTFFAPQVFELPAAAARSSGLCPNFLWDNALYSLGLDTKGKPERALNSFKAFKNFHHKLLDEVNTPMVKALLRFLDHWSPLDAPENPKIQGIYEDLLKGSNLTFTVNGELLTDDISIKHAWDTYYRETDGPLVQCLVTGAWEPLVMVHPAIKKLEGAQSTGAKLVSFNEASFNSYGHSQGENAPVCKYAAFAYTTALNYLLEHRVQTSRFGTCTILYWCIGLEKSREEVLIEAMKQLIAGNRVKDLSEDLLDEPIFILGISPNVSRIYPKFFFQDTIRNLVLNVDEHHRRMEIVKPSYDQFEDVPMWMMFNNLVRPGGELPERTQNSIVKAVIAGTSYPYTMVTNALLRTRAEKDIDRTKAAIIKAYFLQNQNQDCPKEVLTVSLNEESTNLPYNLGRLFSIYETVQDAAIDNISASIKDRYFSSAMTSPGAVFAVLTKLHTAHMRKLERKSKYDGKAAWAFYTYAPQVDKILSLMTESFPAHFSSAEQGAFCLGYYHQNQKRYEKKNNTKEEV